MNILKSLNKTTFSAIHDMNLAAYYCNYLIIMKDGKIYNMGTPEEVLTEKMFKEVFEVNAKINESEYTKKLNIHYIP
jgi:iron complex transport system ATP-binding protein